MSFIFKSHVDKSTNENKLQIILVITALFRNIFNQYFIIIASIIVTNNSQIIVYRIQSHINSGSTNHNNGSVIVVGSIQNKKSFLLEIVLSW